MELLNNIEIRVLGSLVEKEVTTPEYYPLTLNALINACNQKSNRDPVVAYDGQTVNTALESLRKQGLARTMMGDGRVPKYKHYFSEAYTLDPPESAILCELMLRGPQTMGELRGRIERFEMNLMVDEVEMLLEMLAAREEPLVVKLPRQPGRKDSRYAHLLAGMPEITEGEEVATIAAVPRADRIGQLEAELAQLKAEITDLQRQFAEFKAQFE